MPYRPLNDSFTECVKAAADNLTSLESAAKAIYHTMKRIHVRLSKTISILQLRLRLVRDIGQA